MFYRQDEREGLWQRNQISFAERAHEYPCCDVPTVTACVLCDINPLDCKNREEILKAIHNKRFKADAKSRTA